MNPMNENMVRWLLLYDKEILKLIKNKKAIKVYIRPFIMEYGLIKLSIDQITEFQDELKEF